MKARVKCQEYPYWGACSGPDRETQLRGWLLVGQRLHFWDERASDVVNSNQGRIRRAEHKRTIRDVANLVPSVWMGHL